MKENPHYKAIGMMSGTSLDGLDIAYCEFWMDGLEDVWHYALHRAHTFTYPNDLADKLAACMRMSGLELTMLDKELGRWFGEKAREFMAENDLAPDFIASHGHTVFHQPAKSLTLQIGDGVTMAREAGVEIINDFRSKDVALGGQGAPLVPIGDKLLFGEYTACVNLGGISNISFDDKIGERLAYDIGPVNIILNRLARQKGKPYDDDGIMAEGGKCDHSLLKSLNDLPYYREPPPKSLGYEWMEEVVFPLLDNSGLDTVDQLRTATEHIASTIAVSLKLHDIRDRVLFTGGGTLNTFLMDEIRRLSGLEVKVTVPNEETVKYKEALVFAFLGVLRKRGEINCLHSVTGAVSDSCGGVVHKL